MSSPASILSSSKVSVLLIKLHASLYTWEYNEYGQLGTGRFEASYTPLQIENTSDWKEVSAGDDLTFAKKMALFMYGD